MSREAIVTNLFFFLGSLACVAIYVFGSFFRKSQGPSSDELVWFSPIVLFLIGLVLQFFFKEKGWSDYLAFLPLLSIFIIFSVHRAIEQKNMDYKIKMIASHLQDNESYLRKVNSPVLADPSIQYYIRFIRESIEETTLVFARPRPTLTNIDEWGNLSFDPVDKEKGLEMTLVILKNHQMLLFQTGLLKNTFINPHDFANVGYYKGKEFFSDVYSFRFTLENQEGSFELDPKEPSAIHKLHVGTKEIKAAQGASFDQLTRFLRD